MTDEATLRNQFQCCICGRKYTLDRKLKAFGDRPCAKCSAENAIAAPRLYGRIERLAET
jgi:hypothetical protein